LGWRGHTQDWPARVEAELDRVARLVAGWADDLLVHQCDAQAVCEKW